MSVIQKYTIETIWVTISARSGRHCAINALNTFYQQQQKFTNAVIVYSDVTGDSTEITWSNKQHACESDAGKPQSSAILLLLHHDAHLTINVKKKTTASNYDINENKK